MIPKKYLLSLLLLNASLFAEDATSEEEIIVEEHVTVRSRDTDIKKREYMKDLRAKQLEEDEKQQEARLNLRRASAKMAEAEFRIAPRQSVRPQISLASYYPVNSHWLTSIADNNFSIEIEDGSHWEVSSSDAFILRRWRRNDPLVITPNYNWLSSYDYYITNKTDGSYVKANLYVGPIDHGPYSHWIVNIDYFGGHVYLENQMVWCVNPQDIYVLRDWVINDHVILGVYDSWFSSYDHILINVNMDDHIRVKQY